MVLLATNAPTSRPGSPAFPSRTLTWLAEGWRAEFVSDLGTSYVMHIRGTKKTAGAFVERVQRILDGSHMLWTIERDTETPADYAGKGLRPKRGPDGKVIRHAVEWRQPFHEGVKRLSPRGAYPDRRAAWLVSYMRWRGQPCPCNHADVVAHLAAEADVPSKEVRCGIERAARDVARTVGDRVPGNPIAVQAHQHVGGFR